MKKQCLHHCSGIGCNQESYIFKSRILSKTPCSHIAAMHGYHCILWRIFGCWRFHWCKETFVLLLLDKPQKLKMGQLRPMPVISLAQVCIDLCMWIRLRKRVWIWCTLVLVILPLARPNSPTYCLVLPSPQSCTRHTCSGMPYNHHHWHWFSDQHIWVLHYRKLLYSAFLTLRAGGTCIVPVQALYRIGPQFSL